MFQTRFVLECWENLCHGGGGNCKVVVHDVG